VDYFGDVLDAGVIAERYKKDDTGVYTLGLSQSLFIDAALVRGVGASANAPPPNVRPNARFVVNPRSRSARLEVSRKIEAGGEIFVSYGTEYWESAASTTHVTSNVPEWEWDLSNPFACVSALLVPVSCSGLPATPGPFTCCCPFD
jgi:hypothetical protein